MGHREEGRKMLTGYEAIEAAKRDGLTLSKHADPTEGERHGLTIDEATEIAAEDPALIYVAPVTSTKRATTTTKGGYAVVQAGHAILGVGRTPEGARRDANRWLGDTERIGSVDGLRLYYEVGAVIDGDTYLMPISPRLSAAVRATDGQVPYVWDSASRVARCVSGGSRG
jgi:hypothetical protein